MTVCLNSCFKATNEQQKKIGCTLNMLIAYMHERECFAGGRELQQFCIESRLRVRNDKQVIMLNVNDVSACDLDKPDGQRRVIWLGSWIT